MSERWGDVEMTGEMDEMSECDVTDIKVKASSISMRDEKRKKVTTGCW